MAERPRRTRRQQVGYSQSKQNLNPKASPVNTMYSPEQAPIQFGGDREENIKKALASVNNELLDPMIKREQANIERGWAKKAFETKNAIENEVKQSGILHNEELTDDDKKKGLFAIEGRYLQKTAPGFQKLYSTVQNKMRYDWNTEITDANTARYHTQQLGLMKQAVDIQYANPALTEQERAAETFGVLKMYSGHIENGMDGGLNWLVGKISQEANIGVFTHINLLTELNPETGGRLIDSKKHQAAAGTALKKYYTHLETKEEDASKKAHVQRFIESAATGQPTVITALADPNDEFKTLVSLDKTKSMVADGLTKITYDPDNEENNLYTMFGRLSDLGLKHPTYSPLVAGALNNFSQGDMNSSDEKIVEKSLEQFEAAFKIYETASRISGGAKDVLGLTSGDTQILESYKVLKEFFPEAGKETIISNMNNISKVSNSMPSVRISSDDKDALNNAFPYSSGLYTQTEEFKRLSAMLRASGAGLKPDDLTERVIAVMETHYTPVEFENTSDSMLSDLGFGNNVTSYINKDIFSSSLQERTLPDYVSEKFGEGYYLASNPQNPTNSLLLFSIESPLHHGYPVSIETVLDYQHEKYRNEVYDNN